MVLSARKHLFLPNHVNVRALLRTHVPLEISRTALITCTVRPVTWNVYRWMIARDTTLVMSPMEISSVIEVTKEITARREITVGQVLIQNVQPLGPVLAGHIASTVNAAVQKVCFSKIPQQDQHNLINVSRKIWAKSGRRCMIEVNHIATSHPFLLGA